MFNKVICTGLPKSGTSSLAVALCANHVPTVHFGSHECDDMREKMYKGIYKFDVLDKYRGITNALEMIFPQVDKVYPGSKFIHIVRDKDAWLDSAEKHWARMIENIGEEDAMNIHHHLITFGTYLFNKDRFSYVYDMHSNMVTDYFNHRYEDLLMLDITADDDYVYKVCKFLDIPVIDSTPVHSNKG